MTGQELALREATEGAVAQLRSEEFEQQVALALPENVTPQRMLRVTQTAVLEQPNLAKPELRAALLKAVLKAAQDGLLPDGREAVLLPRGGKNPTVSYQPMIGGFRKIAAEHGWLLSAHVVYENDEFEDRGPFENPPILHRPPRPGANRGEAIAAYAFAKHSDGRLLVKVMTKAEIEYVRDKSASYWKDGQLWTTWWDRAWQKTVARALFKELPLDPADRRVSSLIEAAEQNGDARAAIYGPAAGDDDSPSARSEPHRAEPHAGGGEHPPAPAAGTPEPALGSDEPIEGEIVDDPGQYVVPEPYAAAGKTLQEISETDGGREWLKWAAENASDLEFNAALAKFLEQS